MHFLLISISILIVSVLLILLFSQFRKLSAFLFLWSLIAACGFGLCSALSVLCQKAISLPIATEVFRLQGQLPLGEFYVGIDPLSAFFLLLLFVLSLASGIPNDFLQ